MNPGQTTTVSLEYIPTTSVLNYTLSGLPSGTSAPSIRLRRDSLSYPLNPGLNNDLPTGPYNVEAPSVTVDGFTYLAEISPGSFSLAHNQTQSLNIHYVRQSGTLNLTLVGLPSGAMRLEGPTAGNLEAGGSYVLLPGSYTLTASNVERDGFRYVPTVENGSFSLGVGATHNVTVRYLAATARLQVSVTGVSGSTPITVSGPSSRTLEGSATLDFLEPGLYSITPSSVTRNESTPYGVGRYTYRAGAASANLTPGQTVNTTLTYQRQQGNLVVNVSGLPSGSAASLRLEGNGIDHTFAGGSLTDLPAAAVTFIWNAGGTELTINPNADLEYTAAGKNYAFSLTSTATDLAGNPLAPVTSSFTTFRELTRTLTSMAALDGDVRGDGDVATAGSFMEAGDSATADNAQYKSFVSFDLSGLQTDGLTLASRITSAELRVYQEGDIGSPYADLKLGGKSLMAAHVNYGPALNAGDFNTPILHDLGEIAANNIVEYKEKSNALDSVRDDWANRAGRGNRSQFMFYFARATDGDGSHDAAHLTAGESAINPPQLEVKFLVP